MVIAHKLLTMSYNPPLLHRDLTNLQSVKASNLIDISGKYIFRDGNNHLQIFLAATQDSSFINDLRQILDKFQSPNDLIRVLQADHLSCLMNIASGGLDERGFPRLDEFKNFEPKTRLDLSMMQEGRIVTFSDFTKNLGTVN